MSAKKLSRFFYLMAILALAVGLSLTGCKKKTKKTTEDTGTKPAIEDVKTETPGDQTAVPEDQMEKDRQSIRAIFFDYDASSIRSDQRDVVRANGEVFKKWTDWNISIEGHCDERGTNEYNLALGERRATAAKQALVAEGIAAGRVSTVSYGEERPADPGHTESSWSRNRRAEFRTR